MAESFLPTERPSSWLENNSWMIFAHVFAPCSVQKLMTLLQKLGELRQIAGVSSDGQLRRPALHPKVVEKSGERTGISVRGHSISMGCGAAPEK